MRVSAVKAQYHCAVLTSGFVTFIADYHHIRIFNSYVVFDYFGELVVTGDFCLRWKFWYIPEVSFLYSVYELLLGLSVAANPRWIQ